MNKGCIGFSNNKKDFLPRLIRLFTNSGISHTFIITFPKDGKVMIEEASTTVVEGTFQASYSEDSYTDYWMFKIRDGLTTEAQIDEALKYCHDELLGVTYGKLQLLYFPYRWLMKTFFNKDVRHEKNWFTKGVICSELVYYFLHRLGPKFQDLLKDFDPDTIQAQDILEIVEMNPEVFEFVEKKVDSKVTTAA